MRILGAHVDSPRLDLKQNPLYEDTELAMMDTHYYGGVKKYQWVTLPMALHGVVVKKDGEVVQVVIGEKEDDPVVGISDLLIHLSGKQMQKNAAEVVEGENLDVLVGSIPLTDEEKEPVKAQILELLKEQYGIEEEDFLSAELEVVPAGPAKDYGLDRSMIMAYGHDDRVCAYPSFMAMLAQDKVEYTSVCLLVDKEEIGSVGATGMQSRFFENTTAEVMNAAGQYSELSLRRALKNSMMLSSDVSAAFDPNYPEVMEKKNSAYLQATATLWVLGNYSRFIRPGYRRIALDLNESRTFFGSAWLSPEGDKVVAVYTNMSDKAVRLGETHVGWSNEAKSIATYTTTGSKNLVEGTVAAGKQVILEAKSVTTVVYSLK